MTKEDKKMLESALWHIRNSVTNGHLQTAECEITQWLKDKINSFSTEHQIEDLETEIKEYFANVDLKVVTFADIARYFAQWQKQKTIDKVCEWLKNNARSYAFVDTDMIGNVADIDLSLIQDLKKYMEEVK